MLEKRIFEELYTTAKDPTIKGLIDSLKLADVGNYKPFDKLLLQAKNEYFKRIENKNQTSEDVKKIQQLLRYFQILDTEVKKRTEYSETAISIVKLSNEEYEYKSILSHIKTKKKQLLGIMTFLGLINMNSINNPSSEVNMKESKEKTSIIEKTMKNHVAIPKESGINMPIAGIPSPPPGYEFWKIIGDATITAYTPFGKGLMAGKLKHFEDGKTSTMKDATIMDGIATDPKIIPYGTKVYIPLTKEFKIADDTGGHMRKYGRKNKVLIDIRMNNYTKALSFGKHTNQPLILYKKMSQKR